MAWLSVTMRANQVIAGIALNILGAGTAVYVYRIIFGVQSLPPQVTPFAAVNIPGIIIPSGDRTDFLPA